MQHFLWRPTIPKPFWKFGRAGIITPLNCRGFVYVLAWRAILRAQPKEKSWTGAGNPYLVPVCTVRRLNPLQIEKKNLNRKKPHIQCSQYSRKKRKKKKHGKESASQSHRCVKGDVLNLQNGYSKLWIMYEREKLLPCAQRECKQLCCLLRAGCRHRHRWGPTESVANPEFPSWVSPPALAPGLKKEFKMTFIANN